MRLRGLTAGLLLLAATLAGCERPPVDSGQQGFRGTGMVQIDNRAAHDAKLAAQVAPAIDRPSRVRENAPKAGTTYKNIQVLGDLSIGEFGRTMNAITNWVSPQEGCAYCHVDGNFAADDKYTKIVARQMMLMVKQVNSNWSAHVGETGVTCYTCHRGNPLPVQRWFLATVPTTYSGQLMARGGQNSPAPLVGLASLPADPFSTFLLKTDQPQSIRVASTEALASGRPGAVKQAEATYGMMIHVSKSLGVNCTYCHNTRAFASWPESSPARVKAWYGIQMTRNVNSDYLEPLDKTFPALPLGRLGPTGDAAKVNCATCHQGLNKPLAGAKMARKYPALWLTGTAPMLDAPVPGTEPERAVPSEVLASQAAPSAATERASAPPAEATVAAVAPVIAAALSAPSPVPVPAPVAPPALPPSALPSPTASRVVTEAAADKGKPGCAAIQATAVKEATRVPADAESKQVTGSGRLQFHSAPDSGCVMKGIFIVTGESVVALQEFSGYTSVRYRNPRTAIEVSGWVTSTQLAPKAQRR